MEIQFFNRFSFLSCVCLCWVAFVDVPKKTTIRSHKPANHIVIINIILIDYLELFLFLFRFSSLICCFPYSFDSQLKHFWNLKSLCGVCCQGLHFSLRINTFIYVLYLHIPNWECRHTLTQGKTTKCYQNIDSNLKMKWIYFFAI